MPIELTATTRAGRAPRRRSPSASRPSSPTRAAHARPRVRAIPFASIAALQRRALLRSRRARASSAASASTSVHDLVVAASRLARGDASRRDRRQHAHRPSCGTHAPLADRRRVPATSGAPPRSARRSRPIAHDRAVIADGRQRAGQDLTRPATTATRTAGAGASTAARSSARCRRPQRCSSRPCDSPTRAGRALRLRARAAPAPPASSIHDDWDALGMRASGSHSITFDGVELPETALAAASRPAARSRTWRTT